MGFNPESDWGRFNSCMLFFESVLNLRNYDQLNPKRLGPTRGSGSNFIARERHGKQLFRSRAIQAGALREHLSR
jgi:hypothetical protein